jgi:hypothetical protein
MNAAPRSRFLDLPALAALERLRFVPRRRIEGAFSGRHASRRLGGAGEFADFREYAEGEDLRHLDWKVLARTERAYTRLYLAALVTAPATCLGDGLRNLFQQCKRRGVLIVMSDFLVDDLEVVFGSLRLFRNRGWEVITLHIVHPDEETLPEGAAYRFVGMENEGKIDCTS